MPKVGDKEFPYTPEGIAAAKAESQNMEIPMSNGAERSSVDYVGGGKTGFTGIGKPLDVMQGVGNVGITPPEGIKPLGEQGGNQPMGYNPHLREVAPADVMQASEVYYEKGGKVEAKKDYEKYDYDYTGLSEKEAKIQNKLIESGYGASLKRYKGKKRDTNPLKKKYEEGGKAKPKKTKLAGAKKRKRPPVYEFQGFTPISRKKKASPQKRKGK